MAEVQYKSFAEVYDTFMDQTEYEDWYRFIEEKLGEKLKPGCEALELGCGTGNFTRLLSESGMKITALDLSREMLEIAKRKLEGFRRENPELEEVHFLEGDMTDFQIEGEVDIVCSVCDSLNYILKEEELFKVFQNAAHSLKEDGAFFFDMKGPQLYREVFSDHTFGDSREHSGLIWENYYDEETEINTYEISLFMEEENGFYRRYEECHHQKSYELRDILELLYQAGFRRIAVYDGYEELPGDEESQRFVIIARK